MAAKSSYAPAPAAPPAASSEAQSRSDAGSAAPVDQAAASGSALGGLAADSNSKPAVRKPATWLTEIRALRDQGRSPKPGPRSLNSARSTPSGSYRPTWRPLLSE
jgi:hypothetical protein